MNAEIKDLLDKINLKAQKERDEVVMHKQRLHQSYQSLIDFIEFSKKTPSAVPIIEKHGLNIEFKPVDELFSSLEVQDLNNINKELYTEQYNEYRELLIKVKDFKTEIGEIFIEQGKGFI